MITRVTQRMLTGRQLSSIENASTRMADAQEQMTTGRRINRPSDAPADTTVALKARAGITAQAQYQRNAQDGTAWLSTTDTALQSANDLLTRAYTLAVQGANTGSNGQTSENSLADEVDQIKQSMLALANTQYLGRPVFGGTTAGGDAFQEVTAPDGSTSIQYAGDDGTVNRRVGDGTVVRVDTDGRAAFGPDTAGGSNIFDDLDTLSSALRSGDADQISSCIGLMQNGMSRLRAVEADEGARMKQIDTAVGVSQDTTLALQKVQSDVEDVDVAQSTITMQSMNAAYQAALMAVSKTSSQSLLDYLS